MNISNDIIRDTLLCVERKCISYTNQTNRFQYKVAMHWKYIYEDEHLSNLYDVDDIKYCIIKLLEAGLIMGNILGRKDNISYIDIDCITWEGHELLNNIRDDGVWKKIKSKLGDLSTISFTSLAQTASVFAMEALKTKLGM